MESGDLAPGLRVLADRYEILGEVGRGGMATVFLARERTSDRLVAIKTIDGRYAEDAEAQARFAREARMVAALDHPNIVRTLTVEQLGDRATAIVMEYVAGGSLREALRAGGPLSFERAERILADVAEALRYAHARGLVHRDVKPANVFLDRDSGRALLSDFGIARAVEEDNRLTLTGISIGTPSYMSPEQIDGKRLDGRSDIYSLGLLGWEMLAGERPWAGESLYRVIYKQKHEELPRLTLLRPDIPEHLLFAIEGALHKDRETRWADVDEFLEELSERPAPPREMEREDHAPPAARSDDDEAAPGHGGAVTPPPIVLPGVVADAVPYAEEPRTVAELAWPPYDEDHDDGWRVAPRSSRLRARYAVPAALALVAAVAVAGGLRSRREADARSARPATAAADTARRADSLTRTASAGELDPVAVTKPDTVAARPAPSSGAARRRARRPPPTTTGRRDGGAASGAPALVGSARTRRDSLALCRSPAGADQRACLAAAIAENDYGLNNVYRTLIGEMRRQERVARDASDPPSVQRLRAQQRAWLVTRDEACRRRVGQQGALWAAPRARCLAGESTRRAAVLADRLTRLRAP